MHGNVESQVKITVKWVDDEIADLSHLGKFSDQWEESALQNPEWTRDNNRVYRYFIPAMSEREHYESLRTIINPANPAKRPYGVKTARNLARSYVQEDMKRMLDYGETWAMQGCIVTLTVNGSELGHASLWGIESDSDVSYFLEVSKELTEEAYNNAKRNLDKLSGYTLPALEEIPA